MYLKIIIINLSLPDLLIHFSLPTYHTASFQNDAKSVSMCCMTERDLTEKLTFLSCVDCQAFFLKALISLPLASVERGLKMTGLYHAIECDHLICKVLFMKDIRPCLSINTDLTGSKYFLWLLPPFFPLCRHCQELQESKTSIAKILHQFKNLEGMAFLQFTVIYSKSGLR